MIYRGSTEAKAFAKDVFIDQERKLGDRRRLDTVVVLTINDLDWGLGWSFLREGTSSGPAEKSISVWSLGGSIVARQKLKGIDGGAPQEVDSVAQFDPTRGNLPGPDRSRNDRLIALS